MKNRNTRHIFFALILVVLSALLLLPCAALSPVHSVSDAYRGSPYYTNLTELSLTGDARTDLILVALSQLGYHEGNSDADMHGQNTQGSKNFVEYNRLHGVVDNNEGNGTSYGYSWCCSFATWCARQAGISKDLVPNEISCWRLIDKYFKPQGVYHTVAENYTPRAGDYIFFKSKSASAASPSDHIGIVLYANETEVHTIEGNSIYQCVAVRSYALDDSYIVGYASPNYTSKPELAMDFNPKTGGYLLRTANYYVTAESSLRVRDGVGSQSGTLGYLKNGDVVVLLEVDGAWGKINYQGKNGWISLAYVQYIPTRVTAVTPTYVVTLQVGDDLLEQKTVDKGGSITLPDLPARESSDPSRFYFEAVGWDSNGDHIADLLPGEPYTPSADVTLEAVYARKTTFYTVRFIGAGNQVIAEQQYTYGDIPTPPDGTLSVPENGSSFIGWDHAITAVTESTDYIARYTDPPRYTIRFFTKAGAVLSEQKLMYGTTPTRPDDSLMILDDGSTFIGWDAEIVAATGDADYHPLYEMKNHLSPITTDDPEEPGDPADSSDQTTSGKAVFLLLLCGAAVLLLAVATAVLSSRTRIQYMDD